MKSITPHSLIIKLPWYCEMICDGRMASMKGRVKTGNLGQFRIAFKKRTDGCEVVGLMQRRKGNIAREILYDFVVDKNGAIVLGSAMHNTMSDGDWI